MFDTYLKHYRDISGPHVVVVSESTLQNWAREFANWTPGFNIVTLTGTGTEDERAEISLRDTSRKILKSASRRTKCVSSSSRRSKVFVRVYHH